MIIEYKLRKEDAEEMVMYGELDNVENVESYDEILVVVDCETRRVVTYGLDWAGEYLLGDNCYVDVPILEDRSRAMELGDSYVSNIEIANYIDLAKEIPYERALKYVDERRTPEKEEEMLTEKELQEIANEVAVVYRNAGKL